jgi:cytoskeleton protein RodZ
VPPGAVETAAKAQPPAEAAPGAPLPSRAVPAKAAGETKTTSAKPGSDAKAAPAKPGNETKVATAIPGSEPPATPSDAAARLAKSGARKTIHFHFAGDSWVEIRDASGKVLYQRLNPAGSDADVAARPPVDVIVGNAPEVRMTYDGADFPLEPHTNVAVARFTLE